MVMDVPVELLDAIKGLKYIKSSIEGLNEVYGGFLYNSDEIVAIYGKPQVGKTLFCLQEAVASGKNVLYIDTEGGFKGMAQKWYEIFRERFKYKGHIYLESCKTLDALTDFLGFKTRVVFRVADEEDDGGDNDKKRKKDASTVEEKVAEMQRQERREMREKGKMEFRVIERYENALIDGWIKEKDIEFVILDSISAPIRVLMPEERQNLPARATAMALVMGKLVNLQQRHNVCVLVTNHASFNPTDPYQSRDATSPIMRGGISVYHFSKRIIYMDERHGKDYRNFRRLWIMRIEDEPRAGAVVGVKIDDAGFHYVKDVKELLTDGEIKKIGGE
jgi:adenosyl cobinamide kinase/adenosyl cobinamide phosphate guanylyltransferase